MSAPVVSSKMRSSFRSHSIDNSAAFFIKPFFLLLKVVCRSFWSVIGLIMIFLLPIVVFERFISVLVKVLK